MTTMIPTLEIDPFADEVLADPDPFYRELRKAGSVVRVPQSEGFEILAVGRDVHARRIYEDSETFINGRGSGILDLQRDEPFREPGLLVENDPPNHTALRNIMAEVISPRNVRVLRASFQKAADEIVDRLLDLGTFDAQREFAEAFPLKVVPDFIMGAPREGRENLLKYSTFLFESMGPMTPRARRVLDETQGIDAAREWVHNSCQRENVSPESFGGRIWAAVDRGAITEKQAPNLVRSLVGAGIDTTIHSFANTMYLLVQNQDQWQKVREEPAMGRFAYDEALRRCSVVRQNFRTPVRDVDVDGVLLREGQKVMLVPGAANLDPQRWGDGALNYDITRDTSGHLSFGRGIHQCVGAPIVRLEADVLLSTLTRKVKRMEFAGTPVPMLNNTLRGWDSLPVAVTAA